MQSHGQNQQQVTINLGDLFKHLEERKLCDACTEDGPLKRKRPDSLVDDLQLASADYESSKVGRDVPRNLRDIPTKLLAAETPAEVANLSKWLRSSARGIRALPKDNPKDPKDMKDMKNLGINPAGAIPLNPNPINPIYTNYRSGDSGPIRRPTYDNTSTGTVGGGSALAPGKPLASAVKVSSWLNDSVSPSMLAHASLAIGTALGLPPAANALLLAGLTGLYNSDEAAAMVKGMFDTIARTLPMKWDQNHEHLPENVWKTLKDGGQAAIYFIYKDSSNQQLAERIANEGMTAAVAEAFKRMETSAEEKEEAYAAIDVMAATCKALYLGNGSNEYVSTKLANVIIEVGKAAYDPSQYTQIIDLAEKNVTAFREAFDGYLSQPKYESLKTKVIAHKDYVDVLNAAVERMKSINRPPIEAYSIISDNRAIHWSEMVASAVKLVLDGHVAESLGRDVEKIPIAGESSVNEIVIGVMSTFIAGNGQDTTLVTQAEAARGEMVLFILDTELSLANFGDPPPFPSSQISDESIERLYIRESLRLGLNIDWSSGTKEDLADTKKQWIYDWANRNTRWTGEWRPNPSETGHEDRLNLDIRTNIIKREQYFDKNTTGDIRVSLSSFTTTQWDKYDEAGLREESTKWDTRWAEVGSKGYFGSKIGSTPPANPDELALEKRTRISISEAWAEINIRKAGNVRDSLKPFKDIPWDTLSESDLRSKQNEWLLTWKKSANPTSVEVDYDKAIDARIDARWKVLGVSNAPVPTQAPATNPDDIKAEPRMPADCDADKLGVDDSQTREFAGGPSKCVYFAGIHVKPPVMPIEGVSYTTIDESRKALAAWLDLNKQYLPDEHVKIALEQIKKLEIDLSNEKELLALERAVKNVTSIEQINDLTEQVIQFNHTSQAKCPGDYCNRIISMNNSLIKDRTILDGTRGTELPQQVGPHSDIDFNPFGSLPFGTRTTYSASSDNITIEDRRRQLRNWKSALFTVHYTSDRVNEIDRAERMLRKQLDDAIADTTRGTLLDESSGSIRTAYAAVVMNMFTAKSLVLTVDQNNPTMFRLSNEDNMVFAGDRPQLFNMYGDLYIEGSNEGTAYYSDRGIPGSVWAEGTKP